VTRIDNPARLHVDDAKVAAALSDEYARRILAVCVKKARSVKEMEQDTKLPQATVYRHVTGLMDDGLLFIERSALTADGKRYDLYRSRVQKARIELDDAGVRIFWEPLEGVHERLARAWSALGGRI
jgi:DNA-binding transcriptional ArsR family regulator